ncbi:auxin-responsive protein SAUR50 [Rhodamnia argentea]|uniref:Auxin-responsive protein SAUR50 n=1 Tax=Rhodamnia argentea TaxID=178133 RepID=A0A8B8NIN4_9MYRT|nr:auxin-responsive protein SAUR50 [Rhodamnia argentea]
MTANHFLRSCLEKWSKLARNTTSPPSSACERCSLQWVFRPSAYREDDNGFIPRDVPKGHLVVYVGDNHKRYVIKVKVLAHPLFRALLDQAKEEYDYSADSKLCIPCDEKMFMDVVRCAASPHECRICGLCF